MSGLTPPTMATHSPLSSSPNTPESYPTSSLPLDMYQLLHAPTNPATFYPNNTNKSLKLNACPHIHLIKDSNHHHHHTNGSSSTDNLLANYLSLVDYSLAWLKSLKKMDKKKKVKLELPSPQCHICSDSLSRLHVCLHCVYMGCWKKGHMKHHLKSKKHTFAMDFSRRLLYCGDCQDYIYDTELMNKVLKLETLKYNIGKQKFKLRLKKQARWRPYQDEIDTIVYNSKLSSCQGVRGLCNMGNTCFMNVILQSFLHNPLLKAYFLSDQHNPKLCLTKYCLCCEMDRLFAEIYSHQKEPYGPCHFLQAMWMSLKELAGYAQQDAHEFFISALNHIHAGCKDHSMADCQCIVHKTFAGLLQSNVTCSKCGNTTTARDPMLDISLGLRPIEKKKKPASPSPSNKQSNGSATAVKNSSTTNSVVNDLFANSISQVSNINHTPLNNSSNNNHTNNNHINNNHSNSNNNNNNNNSNSNNNSSTNNIIKKPRPGNTLADCLDRYTQPEKLGRNEYVCSNCGSFQEATKQLSIERLPSVLSFQLKRFEHGVSASKIETKIKFPIELDMTPYTTKGKKKLKDYPSNISNVYTLFAVVNHQGRIDTGHYTMFAKHRGQWYKFDDHHVTMAYQKDVLESKAYMCFYIKKILEYEE
ncbi:unnamed protein product [Cunninghamella blakesleeana]